MAGDRINEFGFAPAHDRPIPYIQRISDYYRALGYGAPYEWAHYAQVPFQTLAKPLAESRVAIITTAAPYQPDKGDQGPGAPYNAAAKFYDVYSGDTSRDHDLRISHVAIDRKHTTAEDPGTYFPLSQLRQAAACGRIGSIAPRFHGLPTNRSHRRTLDVDCQEIVDRCRGIATVIMGCAKDIVEFVGVPRLLFSDFPLGNGAGRPNDVTSQTFTLELALSVLETAPCARTTVQSPLVWSRNPDWKLDFMSHSELSAEEIARRRADFDKQKAVAKALREESGNIESDVVAIA
ncbi:MAG: glycine reductase [Alphaproteobacteria bacterium]